MSWINNIQSARWDGNRANNYNVLNISTINVNYISSGIINASTINTNTLSVGVLNVSSFINLPSTLNASNWSYYPALSTVQGLKDITGIPQVNIKDFDTITARTLKAEISGFPAQGGSIIADLDIQAPLGDITEIITNKIECGEGSGEINVYGADLVAGDSALYVEGGTTLSGGGLIHGVTIGALTVAGINTQRIDVLPSGIDIISPTYVTIDSAAVANLAAGATLSVAAGGTLSLAGGAYIEYNTDQNYFVNTSAGNDFTDIFVGNIHGANFGTRPLRINEGRGVEIDNATHINLQNRNFTQWNSNTVYNQNDIVEYSNARYTAFIQNRTVEPNSNYKIPKWTSNVTVLPAQYVSSIATFKCISTITSNLNVVSPNFTYPSGLSSFSNVWLPLSSISTVNQFWGLMPTAGDSYIAGDKYSFARLGAISTNTISTSTQTANRISMLSDDTNPSAIGFKDSSDNTFAVIGDGGGNQLGIATTDTFSVQSGRDITLLAQSNASLICYEQLVVGASNASFIGTYEANITSFGNLQLGAISNVDIESANNVNVNANYFNVQTTNRIDLSANIIDISANAIFIDAATKIIPGIEAPIVLTSTIRTYPGSNLTLDTNRVDVNYISTNILNADKIYTNYLYASNLDLSNNNISNVDNFYVNNIYASTQPNITIKNNLDLSNNNISNVNQMNINFISSGIFYAAEVYTLSLGHPSPIAPAPIHVNNGFDMLGTGILQNGFIFTDLIGSYTYPYTTINCQVNLSSNTISNVSSISYVDYITSNQFPVYVGGQIQHWNPNGGYYDFYYSQLYYTDIANEAQNGIDGYSNHRAIAQDWSYYKCENINLDMGGNFITNCGGLSLGTLYVNQAVGGPSGYVDAGVAFSALTGDDYWWQIIKPQFPSFSPPGDEGIYIVRRLTSDGSENARGRIYDDSIYTPWSNVTGDLFMNSFYINFIDQTTSIDWGINFNNNFLQYTQQPAVATRYVAQDWSYFPAEHYVDMSGNDISGAARITTENIDVSGVFTYKSIIQPIIQCGSGNTGSAGTTITLPTAYPSSNYCIQLTYHNNPSGNKPLYHDSITASDFFVDGDPNADFDWTTFYVP